MKRMEKAIKKLVIIILPFFLLILSAYPLTIAILITLTSRLCSYSQRQAASSSSTFFDLSFVSSYDFLINPWTARFKVESIDTILLFSDLNPLLIIFSPVVGAPSALLDKTVVFMFMMQNSRMKVRVTFRWIMFILDVIWKFFFGYIGLWCIRILYTCTVDNDNVGISVECFDCINETITMSYGVWCCLNVISWSLNLPWVRWKMKVSKVVNSRPKWRLLRSLTQEIQLAMFYYWNNIHHLTCDSSNSGSLYCL